MISPIDCSHPNPLFIQSESGGPPHRSSRVSVCSDCGRFRLSATRDGATIVTTFDLPCWHLVDAASQYARLLEGDEPRDLPRVIRNFVHRWTFGRRESVPGDLRRLPTLAAAYVAIKVFAGLDPGEPQLSWLEALERRSKSLPKITENDDTY